MAENPGFQAPFQILEDSWYIERPAPMTSHAPMLSIPKGSRAPLANARSNVIFNPIQTAQNNRSPVKAKTSRPSEGRRKATASSPSRRPLSAAAAASNKGPYLSQFKTTQHKPTDGSWIQGKENELPAQRPSTSSSLADSSRNANRKRGLMEAAPISDRLPLSDSRPTKKRKSDDDDNALPAHDSFPTIADDGLKPSHSYAQLIGMAILRSPQRRLTLAQIYKWISGTYSFYSAADMGWQNSIRHNLSLHKNFLKTERPKDDPGKGHYWTIEPGTEMQFLKEKPSRKAAPTAENLPVMSTRLEPSEPLALSEPNLHMPAAMSFNTLPDLPPPQPIVHIPAEPSSDATIPASDHIFPFNGAETSAQQDGTLDAGLYSSLPAAMHSSPPVARTRLSRKGTSPLVAPKSHEPKQTLSIPEDSGYISSLESSAMRPNQRPLKAHLLTSGAERPRAKRGRAEEEIARLRGSSPYSPTKSRSHNAYHPVSSSPLRQAHGRASLGPVTPKLSMFKRLEPPPSVSMFMSPNKSLALHRSKMSKLLGSPVRDSPVANGTSAWGVGPRSHEPNFLEDLIATRPDWDLYGMADMGSPFAGCNVVGDPASPLVRSTQRKRLPRTNSDSNLLNFGMTPSLKDKFFGDLPELSDMAALDTPSKYFEGLSSPSKMQPPTPCRMTSSRLAANMAEMAPPGDWPGPPLDLTEFMGKDMPTLVDFPGFDMLQGFERIGSGRPQPLQQQERQQQQQPIAPRKSKKPQLGRSTTSRF